MLRPLSGFRLLGDSVRLWSIMLRGMDRWLLGYLGSLLRRPGKVDGVRHLILAVCDHYEPYRGEADQATARGYVDRWVREFPAMAEPFRDADGRMPQHTFFYPEEEYDPVCLEQLGRLMRQGCGEVEIHLHHRNDTAEGLREKLVRFRDLLRAEHGMLGERVSGVGCRKSDGRGGRGSTCKSTCKSTEESIRTSTRTLTRESSPADDECLRSPAYAFIHGNWSLCNSRPDGDWCGVNEELGVLAETGCYADLTFPSAPSPTQPRIVNAIYRATDRPEGRGHDSGERVRVGGEGEEKGGRGLTCRSMCKSTEESIRTSTRTLTRESSPSLLLVQGPLGLNFSRRKWGVLPRIENAEISGVNPPVPDRVKLWARTGIHVAGRPEWVFVKLHTHGCMPANADVLLGEPMRAMHRVLQEQYNDGANWQLHYVTSREMVNMILAAEAGCSGSPGEYRDYVIGRPPALQRG